MSYCYSEMDNPTFFYEAGKCGEINHDLQIKNGNLTSNNSLISSILIQLHTDGAVIDNNGRTLKGWWGDEFADFPIGTSLWNIKENAKYNERVANAEETIMTAMEKLTEQGLIDNVNVSITQVINGLDIEVGISKQGEDILTLTNNVR